MSRTAEIHLTNPEQIIDKYGKDYVLKYQRICLETGKVPSIAALCELMGFNRRKLYDRSKLMLTCLEEYRVALFRCIPAQVELTAEDSEVEDEWNPQEHLEAYVSFLIFQYGKDAKQAVCSQPSGMTRILNGRAASFKPLSTKELMSWMNGNGHGSLGKYYAVTKARLEALEATRIRLWVDVIEDQSRLLQMVC